jgi:hypothetical protein
MASQDNLLSKLADLVAGFDDASWEALASKGLLRRARKEIEKGLAIEVIGETESALEINVPPFVVSIPASGPAKATCSCPAPGVCQHILCAGLHLQSHIRSSGERKVHATEDSIRKELSLLGLDRIKAWAGGAEYRSGVSLFEKNTLPPIIEYQETVVVRLMPSGIEVRFVPGGGLDSMILPKSQGARAGVASLLALRKSLGLEIPVVATQQSLVEVGGTPRTQKEILASAQTVLEDAIMVGLSHASPTVVERLVTLAVSAQGANLPRVSLALKAVSDEVRSILQRDARADESRLFIMAARVYALMDAISSGPETPRMELAGMHRGQYVDVPEIDLSGVGAYTWKTGSGYAGLTVLFWSNQTREFLSWSEARPATQQFDPRQRFYAEGPWDGAQSPRQVASSNLKLRNARRTAAGRLSGSTKTSALVLSETAPQSLEFGERLFASWEVLRRHLVQKQPLGFLESNPLDLIGVLEPSAFGPRSFDEITQTFTWEVYDQLGQALTLSLPFRDWSKDAIRVLEGLTPPNDVRWRLMARLALRDDSLSVEPISILRPEDKKSPVFQLGFDLLPKQSPKSTTNVNGTSEEEASLQEEGSEVEESSVPTRTYLHGILAELNRRLQTIAEAGCQGGFEAHRDWFVGSYREVHDAGLTCLSGALESLSKPSSIPRSVLRARFLNFLHAQATARLT